MMELSVYERLLLGNILKPMQSNFATLRIVRDLLGELSFSEEEHAALELRMEDGGAIHWKREADEPKKIEIGPKARKIIADRLRDLSARNLLTLQHMDLYERFVDED